MSKKDLHLRKSNSDVFQFRSLIQAIFYIPAALILKDPLFGISGERWYLFQRAAFGYICFTLSYYSLKFVSLSDSSSIVFSAPVFVSIFACIILHEPCGVFQITNVFFTLVGVILISHPSFIFGGTGEDANFTAGDRLIGAILAFLSCLTMAYTFVSMRRLQKTPTTSVIAFFSTFCVVCGGVTVIIMHFAVPSYEVRTLSSDDWIFLVINGLCGVFGQLFLVTALKIEEAGLVSLVRTFDIVMSFIYQVFCLHQSAPLLSIIGAAIVFCGCVACGLKKFFASKAREEESDIISDMDERTSCETIDTIKR